MVFNLLSLAVINGSDEHGAKIEPQCISDRHRIDLELLDLPFIFCNMFSIIGVVI